MADYANPAGSFPPSSDTFECCLTLLTLGYDEDVDGSPEHRMEASPS